MEKDSLGLIETLGLVGALEAADAGSKAANVTFRGYERGRAGLITVVFSGDVAAVRAAVAAGVAAAKRVGQVVSVDVIARPDRQLHVTRDAAKPAEQEIAEAKSAQKTGLPESAPRQASATPEEQIATAAAATVASPDEAGAGLAVPEPSAVAVPEADEPVAPVQHWTQEIPTGGNGDSPPSDSANTSATAEEAVTVAPGPARKKERVRKMRTRKKV